jgi:poly(A) polymerase
MRASGVLSRVLPDADDTALGPLVHLEASQGIGPEPLRRLAALGGDDAAGRFRLSKKDAVTLAILKTGIGSGETAARLGYHHGFNIARDVLLLRAAIFETPVEADAMTQARTGASANFPLKAGDLMPEFSGPALGRRLETLEAAWIDSGFALSAAALLALPDT